MFSMWSEVSKQQWFSLLKFPLPENKRDVKRFAKDSQSWVNGRMKDKKGVELKWSEIPKHRIPDFQQAKAKELSNWLKQSAVRLAGQHAPRERTLRMRWVFNIKQERISESKTGDCGFRGPGFNHTSKVISCDDTSHQGFVF